jgi:hypothetical protein
MHRETASGTLLIVGSLAYLLVMGLHPNVHDLLEGPGAAHQARINVFVHALAIAAVPAVFLGFLGLSRRLRHGDLSIAALVVHGFGSIGVMLAAAASGFLATWSIQEMLDAGGAARDLQHALLGYTHVINQTFTAIYVMASSVAIFLWSVVILRGAQLSRAAGTAGMVAAASVLLVFLTGHVQLDVHGFGMIVVVHAAWTIWIGVLLLRPEPAASQT